MPNLMELTPCYLAVLVDLGPQGPQGNMGSTPLGLAFGRMGISSTGILQVEYYGSASDNDFSINANGELIVSI